MKNIQLTEHFRLFEFISGIAVPVKGTEMTKEWLLTQPQHKYNEIISNILEIAEELQSLRNELNEKFGKTSIIVTSGLRCLEWELHQKRGGLSQHVQGNAADFKAINQSKQKEVNEYLIKRYTNYMGGFAYPKNYSFFHLDTRQPTAEHKARGWGARWVY